MEETTMNLVIELNPLVREIIEAATKAAQPVWLGATDGGGGECFVRVPVYMEPDGPEGYFNTESVTLGPTMVDVSVDIAFLAKTKTGAPDIPGAHGPVLNTNGSGFINLSYGCSLCF